MFITNLKRYDWFKSKSLVFDRNSLVNKILNTVYVFCFFVINYAKLLNPELQSREFRKKEMNPLKFGHFSITLQPRTLAIHELRKKQNGIRALHR